jgi:hypothetical protein
MKKYSLLGFLCLLSGTLFAAAERDLMSEAFDVLSQAVTLKPGAILTQDNFPQAIKLLSGDLRRRYELPSLFLKANLKMRKVTSLYQKAAADCGLYAAFHMGLFLKEENGENVGNMNDWVGQYAEFKKRYLEWVENDAWAYNPAQSDDGDDFAAHFISTSVINGYFYVNNGLERTRKVHVFEYVPSPRKKEVYNYKPYIQGQPLSREPNDVKDSVLVKDKRTGALYVRHTKEYNYGDNLFVNQLQQSCYVHGESEAIRKAKEAKELHLLRMFRSAPKESEVGVFDQRQFIKDWYRFFSHPEDPTPLYCIVTNAGHFNAIKFYKKDGQTHADVRDSLGLAENNVTFVYNTMLNLFNSGQLKKYDEAARDDAQFIIEYPSGSSVVDELRTLLEDVNQDLWKDNMIIDSLRTIVATSQTDEFWAQDLLKREFVFYFKRSTHGQGDDSSVTRISLWFKVRGELPLFETDKEDSEVPAQTSDEYSNQNGKSWADYVKENLLMPLYEKIMAEKGCS